MRELIRSAIDGFGRSLAQTRNLLRLVMPQVAAAATIFLVVWVFVRNSRVYQTSSLSWLFGLITSLLLFLTITYFGLKILHWLERRLLWRVRRRLVITFLLIGLTPIVLLSLLGIAMAIGGSNRALVRVVKAQMQATTKEALADVHNIAEALGRLPPMVRDEDIQLWLDDRTASLQPSLPGARVVLWRSVTVEADGMLGAIKTEKFVAGPEDEKTRDVGGDVALAEVGLPNWLRGRVEWSGLAYVPISRESREFFDTPFICAVVRGEAGGHAFALLIVEPISRALVQHFYDNTGVRLHLFFVNWKRLAAGADRSPTDDDGNEEKIDAVIKQDQFGEPIDEKRFPILLTATDWTSGEQTPQRLAFWLSWTWDQLLGGGLRSEEGELWGRILLIISSFLFGIEMLALVAAALMTRAITGTVHRLYLATELTKRGDFSHRVRIRSRDQLGELAKSFNEMSANITSLLEERVKYERLQREVEIATEVQAQMFPRETPHLETAEITGECRAARGVAGDYYDYIDVAPGLIALALGDVAGKGISAALLMSNLQAALRSQVTIMAEETLQDAECAEAIAAVIKSGISQRIDAPLRTEVSTEVATMVRVLNIQLCRSIDSNRFATLFLALFNEQTRSLRYTNAGHNAPILVRADGTVERLSAGGLMVGAFDWAPYEEAHTTLETGDVLLIFSDGLSEAQNESGEEYGEERLSQCAGKLRELSVDMMRRIIFDEIDKWSGVAERGDDQTLVILKLTSSPPKR